MTIADLNAKSKIQDRPASGLVSWKWPLAIRIAHFLIDF